MISPSYVNNSREETVGYNVSCFDDTYVSDDDFSVEQSAQTNIKRQKMTEEERLTRCRERNRVHARNTRERKKSQMDGLQSRIQELVDEKKRLNSTASESSIASILMSLAGFGLPNIDGTGIAAKVENDKDYLSMLPFKVDDDEDDIAISIEKLKMQVSALLGDEDCKDIMDADPLLMKDKSTCSTSELEMIRRERNRMHAKKTRLRKKKMIQEMETIIASLEKEITDMQGGLTPSFPTRPESGMDISVPVKEETPEKTLVMNSNNYAVQERPIAVTSPEIKIETHETFAERDSNLTRTISVDAPSSSCSKKRKHLAPPTSVDCRAKHFSTPKYEPYEPAESADITQAEDDRVLQQYLWRQHTAKNSVKTVSICSESASGSSEGSLSEGDLSSGSAVHSLLHMSRTNSSDSRGSGSGSGSDESDAAPSEHVTAPSSQTTFQPHSRNHMHSGRVGEKRTGASVIYPTIASPSAPITTPKTIQAILAACESKGSTVYGTLPPNHQLLDQPNGAQSHPHWRFPERAGGLIGTDIRIAASTVAAVASIYPLHSTVADPSLYRGFIPMKAVDGPVFYTAGTTEGLRNHNFTVYGGLRPPTSSSTELSNPPPKKRVMHAAPQEGHRLKEIPQELDVTESPAFESVPSPSQVYSIFVPEQSQERLNQQQQQRQHNTSNVSMKSFTDCSTAPHPFTGCSNDLKKSQSTIHSHCDITNDMKEAASKTMSYRPVLPEGVLDYSSFKSSELMPPSL